MWIAGGQHDGRLGASVTLVGTGADCKPSGNLVSDLLGVVGNRRRDDRAAHHRRCGRLRRTRHRRILDQVSVGHRCHRADLSGRRRTGSRGVSAEVEGSGSDRFDQLPVSISRLRCRRLLPARMGGHAELACRRRHVHDVRRRGLRGDDRVRLEHNGVRQDGSRCLLYHRPRHRRGIGAHFCAVYGQDTDLHRRWHHCLCGTCLG